jgi:hypothetical protein
MRILSRTLTTGDRSSTTDTSAHAYGQILRMVTRICKTRRAYQSIKYEFKEKVATCLLPNLTDRISKVR